MRWQPRLAGNNNFILSFDKFPILQILRKIFGPFFLLKFFFLRIVQVFFAITYFNLIKH